MQPLTELLRAAGLAADASIAKDMAITSITADSRQVKKGSLFVAIKGEKADGTQFIGQAAKQGAVAALCQEGAQVSAELPVIHVPNIRLALAKLAAAFYAKQPEHIVAVTGTDGKTSTADFTRQLWHGLGMASASMGTVGITLAGGELLEDASHTTPDPVQLHKLLAQLEQQGCTHLSMEASSHGLHQHRLDGVRLQAAAFTTFARDHMDYHATEDDYFSAKARLFSELLPEGATAVLNRDDKSFARLQEICKARHIRITEYGKAAQQLQIEQVTPHAAGQQVQCRLDGTPHRLDIPLVGGFQVYNIFAAIGLVQATGVTLDAMVPVIGQLKGVPGRLEHVATLTNGAAVYIDYAHTPMALTNVLRSLRPHTQHHLHVVFGCGGDRDAGKRPLMGKAASELADHVIVTDDNPRHEDAAAIRQQVLAGGPDATEIADRKEAIHAALQALQAGDVLVIAGKGHEKTQTIGTDILPFHDGAVAMKAAQEMELVHA